MITLNTLRRLTRKDYAFILLLIVALYFVTIYLLADNARKINETKITMMEQEQIKLEAKANKRSDIEILEAKASENADYVKSRLEEIESYKEAIKILEWLYETELLTQRCYESQIDRKINDLEYNLDYCEEEVNLDQFRSKKY